METSIKEELVNILKENKQLKEELRMAKTMKEQNEEKKDTQAPASAPVPPADGAKEIPLGQGRATSDVVKEQNEETKDTQAPASAPVPVADGAKEIPKTQGRATSDVVKEQDETPEKDKMKEQEGEEDKMKEQEVPTNDMDSIVEILEALTQKCSMLEQKMAAMESAMGQKAEQAKVEAPVETPEPMEPMEESQRITRMIFTENQVGATDNRFVEQVGKLLFNKK